MKGDALISLGRLTEKGYAFLFVGNMGWIFDKDMQLVKGVRRDNYVNIRTKNRVQDRESNPGPTPLGVWT